MKTPDARAFKVLLIALVLVQLAPAQAPSVANALTDPSARLNDFQVIELRRHTVNDGARKNFVQYFEAYFPEAIERTGAIVAGSFFERNQPNGFTWIRGFHTWKLVLSTTRPSTLSAASAIVQRTHTLSTNRIAANVQSSAKCPCGFTVDDLFKGSVLQISDWLMKEAGAHGSVRFNDG